jgi:hypothetical protein
MPFYREINDATSQALLVMARGGLTALGTLAYVARSLLAEYLMPLLESLR